MQSLLRTLDDEVRVLEALVRVTQREQQHLLAFEVDGLDIVVEEKRRLLEREDTLRSAREELVFEGLHRVGAPAEERRLEHLIERLPESSAGALRLRRDRVRALLTALSELNAVAAHHAKRQLRWARACRKRLEPAGTGTYDQQGRAHPTRGQGLVLNGAV